MNRCCNLDKISDYFIEILSEFIPKDPVIDFLIIHNVFTIYLVIQVCFYLYDDESFEYLSRTITLGDK